MRESVFDFPNHGTHVTNFYEDDLEWYVKATSEYGDADLVIRNTRYDGSPGYSLHDLQRGAEGRIRDISPFWRIFVRHRRAAKEG